MHAALCEPFFNHGVHIHERFHSDAHDSLTQRLTKVSRASEPCRCRHFHERGNAKVAGFAHIAPELPNAWVTQAALLAQQTQERLLHCGFDVLTNVGVRDAICHQTQVLFETLVPHDACQRAPLPRIPTNHVANAGAVRM